MHNQDKSELRKLFANMINMVEVGYYIFKLDNALKNEFYKQCQRAKIEPHELMVKLVLRGTKYCKDKADKNELKTIEEHEKHIRESLAAIQKLKQEKRGK